MRQLIINADDLGAYSERSRGIFEAWENGVVTSASLLCNGRDSEVAIGYANEHGLPTGLHIALTEGKPMGAPRDVVSLLGSDGLFPVRAEQYRAFSEGRVDPGDLEREIVAQLEWFLARYGQPTHVDGHHHMHVHPAVVPVLIPILGRYGIDRVRIPHEDRSPHQHGVTGQQLKQVLRVSNDAVAARPLFAEKGIRSTDHFCGMFLMGQASPQCLRHLLDRLPDGTTELMVHAGHPTTTGGWFDTDPQRQIEFAMLTDPDLRAFIDERSITLLSYRDLG